MKRLTARTSKHMKSHLFQACLITTLFFPCKDMFSQAVSINADGIAPDPSAILDVKSSDKGLLVPRMTAAQRVNIEDPATGLIVYQTDEASGFYYNGGSSSTPLWVLLIAGPIHGDDIASGVQTTTNTTLALGNSNNSAAELRLLEPNASGTNYTAFKSQPQTDNITYTLPDKAPAVNEVLKIESVLNNTATLDWAIPSSGAPIFNRTDISVQNGNVTLDAAGKSFIRMMTASGTFNLTGFSGGVDGQLLILVNLTNRAMTIVNEDAGSNPVNRIHTESNSNFIKLGGEVCTFFIYDGGQGRWRMF